MRREYKESGTSHFKGSELHEIKIINIHKQIECFGLQDAGFFFFILTCHRPNFGSSYRG